MVRRVAAMLDLDPDTFAEGDALPLSWHFFMLAGDTQRSVLRPDGFPGLGVPIPDLGLPRLLLGGRTVLYQGVIAIGAEVERTSFVKSISEKTTRSGPMAIVTVQHELRPVFDPSPVIIETQTYILLSGATGQAKAAQTPIEPIQAHYQKQVIPDETLLFQYSALGFNSHKIHLDRNYTRTVEGLPDLVVNGGLSALLLTEFLRTDLGITPTELTVKHVASLFCNRPLTLTANQSETGWQLSILDDTNRVAVIMEANRSTLAVHNPQSTIHNSDV
jgi:3-methylfumaryl-CoA hydratase